MKLIKATVDNLPKTCGNCPFSDEDIYRSFIRIRATCEIGKRQKWQDFYKRRHPDCPLDLEEGE